MKKVLRVLLIIAGLGVLWYVLVQRQAQAHRIWDEVLARVPTPEWAGHHTHDADTDESAEPIAYIPPEPDDD